ncbi:MAG: hypothetical protein AAF658_15920, partial [Myxococcota bacterium]
LISMFSIPPLVWGMVFADRAHRDAQGAVRNALLGGVLISVAALFRFQIGIVFIVVFALLVLQRRSIGVALAFLGGGLVGALAQAGLDFHAFGSLVPAPWLYIEYNLRESNRFGVGPWYSYFGMFLLLTLPPATFAVAAGMWRGEKGQWIVSIPFAVFFVFHSAVPHKEERFLFPLIPLFFVLLAAGLVSAWRAGGWRRGFVRYFWVVNSILLVGATASDAHRNVTTPMLDAGRRGDVVAFYGVGDMLVPVFYLSDGDTKGYLVRSTKILLERLDSASYQGRVRVLFDRTPKDWERAALAQRASCDNEFLSYGDPVDQLLVWVNPVGNRHRRGAKTVIDCVFGERE